MEYLSLGISLIALIVSVLSLIVSWLAYRRDRGDLQLRIEYLPETGLGSACRVVLTNQGRRPVQIERVLLRFKSGVEWSYAELSGKNANLPTKLPTILEESGSCDLLFPLYDGRSMHNALEIKQVEAYDSLGKRYMEPFAIPTADKS